MSPAEILGAARAEGVQLTLSPVAGQLRMAGDEGRVGRWAPLVRASKAAIVEALQKEEREGEAFEREERAAIFEFDAKLPRAEAERRAGARRTVEPTNRGGISDG